MSKVLKKLLKAGEGEQNDYKLTLSKPEKVAKTLTAFANHLGGTLVVGVRDDRTIIGIDAEEEKYVASQAAEVFADPPVPLAFQTIFVSGEAPEENEKQVLLVRVSISQQRPHYAMDKDGDRTLYIRQADQTLPASAQITQQLEQGTYAPQREKDLIQVKDAGARQVLSYVQKHQKVTVKVAAQKFNLSERRAQRLLTEMCREGLLRAHDHEKVIYFTR